MEKYSITITFEKMTGINRKGTSEETKTFSFRTLAEVEAFRDGVWEMYGNDDYQIEGAN